MFEGRDKTEALVMKHKQIVSKEKLPSPIHEKIHMKFCPQNPPDLISSLDWLIQSLNRLHKDIQDNLESIP